MTEQIRTIEDMEKLFYSPAGVQFLNTGDLQSSFIMKDDPVASTTTGVYNAVYGAQAWIQLNMEANTFGCLPKVPYGRSGWRVITARGDTMPYGGRAETAALPATIKPTFKEVSTKPKIIAVTFETTEIQEFLATEAEDDAFAAMVDLRAYFAVEHKEDMNVQLNTENGTLASYNLESIDRVIASNGERTSCSQNDESTPYTSGDLNIYGLIRETSSRDTFSDAYVSHNSSTVRSLTESVLHTLVQNVLKQGGYPSFFQTGYDTWAVINQLFEPQVRYNLIGEANIQPSVNGINTHPGQGVGFKCATLYGYPVILSKNTVQDTGGISRIYLMDCSNPEGFDLPRMCIKIAKPTQYFEAGINQGNPFAVAKFGNKGMYRTMAELICTAMFAQGKVRDLKA